jgi:hypothetical protein
VTVAEAIKVQGDYGLRGPDFETVLVGAVTGEIGDADRMVRFEWRNGFPNWDLYRTAYAGDTHLRERLFCFCVGFAIAYGQEDGVSRKVYSDELGYAAGRDAYTALVEKRWEFTPQQVADALGVDPKTYRKFRGKVYNRLIASVDEYWIRMQVAIRQVYMVNRNLSAPTPAPRYSDGRGFGEMDLSGDGNFRAMPRGSGT